MRVRIRLFAVLRERAGAGEVELELPERATVADALGRLGALAEGVPVVLAVNREYASGEVVLRASDELALIPPVSGGAGARTHARVSEAPLRLEHLLELVRDPAAGAVTSFLGVTREVPALEYEAYVPMAEAKLGEILRAAAARHGLCAAAAEHRVGTVPLSEPSVAIAVSAPHRAEAFAGAREVIDEIKRQAPIWKREEGEWVSGSSPAP